MRGKSSSSMERLFELLARELERVRDLSAQVARHLHSTYGVSRDAVGSFLQEELPGLEDYEIDLVLSPVFTPTLNDQVLFAPTLGKDSLTAKEISTLIQRLAARGTIAPLRTEDGQTHPIRLREVSVARYVERLRLDGSISDELHQWIMSTVPEGDRALVLAVARRAVWTPPLRAALLQQYLERSSAQGEFRADDVSTLLRLVETYEPVDIAEFQARLPGWIEAVRQEASAAMQPKRFFNERVEDMHGGGRDQRRGADPRAAAREAELESYRRLARILSR
jgi:hypothetical protein